MWGSGLSNFGQAYQIGNAQNPFFRMQGMLPQAGLQPGAIQGAGTGAPILGRPMLPPGVTPEMAMLPGGIPGLGAPLPMLPAAQAPQPTRVVRNPVKEFQGGRGIDAKADRDRRAKGKSGPEPGADPKSFGG